MALPGIIAGAAARAGAKKLAEKGGKKAVDKDFLKGYALPTSVVGGSGIGAAAVGEKSRNERDEAERQMRESKDEMKRETRGMKKGGKVHDDIKKDKPMMEKVAKKAVKGHEARMHGSKKMMGGGMAKAYKSGGSIDGCATKGKTKGKQIKMAGGGKC